MSWAVPLSRLVVILFDPDKVELERLGEDGGKGLGGFVESFVHHISDLRQSRFFRSGRQEHSSDTKS